LVTRYTSEAGSELIDWPGGDVISAVALVELPSALWRKHRLGELDAGDAATLVAAFDHDTSPRGDHPPRFLAIALDGRVLARAAGVTRHHGLRTLDSIQLASALEARDHVPGLDTVVAFDLDLRAAALAEGFTVLPA
jgi:hypothetical protein